MSANMASLVWRTIQYIVGEFARAVNYRANGGAVEIVAGQSEAGEGGDFLR